MGVRGLSPELKLQVRESDHSELRLRMVELHPNSLTRLYGNDINLVRARKTLDFTFSM
jgi:hypothetical protein